MLPSQASEDAYENDFAVEENLTKEAEHEFQEEEEEPASSRKIKRGTPGLSNANDEEEEEEEDDQSPTKKRRGNQDVEEEEEELEKENNGSSRRAGRKNKKKSNTQAPPQSPGINSALSGHRNVNTAGKPPEAGIIQRIYVENFMCHRKLTVDLCRNVNFIYGQNGSGKVRRLNASKVMFGRCTSCFSQKSTLFFPSSPPVGYPRCHSNLLGCWCPSHQPSSQLEGAGP